MINEKNKFTAFVTKNGSCSIQKKNCYLQVGIDTSDGQCVFYFDEKSGIQASEKTAEFIKRDENK